MSQSPQQIRFAADIMVGRLARWLRILGYDTLYEANKSVTDLIEKAKKEKRVLLTRRTRLIQDNPDVHSFLLHQQNPKLQLITVMNEFDLGTDWIFNRCTLCNVGVESVPAEVIKQKVPEKIYQNSSRFYRCPNCKKIYWQGSHIQRFEKFIFELKITIQPTKHTKHTKNNDK